MGIDMKGRITFRFDYPGTMGFGRWLNIRLFADGQGAPTPFTSDEVPFVIPRDGKIMAQSNCPPESFVVVVNGKECPELPANVKCGDGIAVKGKASFYRPIVLVHLIFDEEENQMDVERLFFQAEIEKQKTRAELAERKLDIAVKHLLKTEETLEKIKALEPRKKRYAIQHPGTLRQVEGDDPKVLEKTYFEGFNPAYEIDDRGNRIKDTEPVSQIFNRSQIIEAYDGTWHWQMNRREHLDAMCKKLGF